MNENLKRLIDSLKAERKLNKQLQTIIEMKDEQIAILRAENEMLKFQMPMLEDEEWGQVKH